MGAPQCGQRLTLGSTSQRNQDFFALSTHGHVSAALGCENSRPDQVTVGRVWDCHQYTSRLRIGLPASIVGHSLICTHQCRRKLASHYTPLTRCRLSFREERSCIPRTSAPRCRLCRSPCRHSRNKRYRHNCHADNRLPLCTLGHRFSCRNHCRRIRTCPCKAPRHWHPPGQTATTCTFQRQATTNCKCCTAYHTHFRNIRRRYNGHSRTRCPMCTVCHWTFCMRQLRHTCHCRRHCMVRLLIPTDRLEILPPCMNLACKHYHPPARRSHRLGSLCFPTRRKP